MRNHRDIKLVTSNKRRKRLVSEPNYHSHKKSSNNLMAIEMKKTRVKMTKPLYLGISISDISKMLMYDFGTIILTQSMETKQNYDTDSFIINIKTEYFLKLFLIVLRDGLIRLIMIKMIKDLFQKVRIKKYLVFLKMN